MKVRDDCSRGVEISGLGLFSWLVATLVFAGAVEYE
jgi:hypothetical protein